MITSAIAIITAALVFQAAPQASTGGPPEKPAADREASSWTQANDPLLGRLGGDVQNHPSLLYRKVRSEPRDPAWAAGAEAALSAHYEPLSSSGRVEDLRILCAATICEVAGAVTGKTLDEINATSRRLQDRRLNERMSQAGLEIQSAIFGSRPNSRQSVFATYWARSAP